MNSKVAATTCLVLSPTLIKALFSFASERKQKLEDIKKNIRDAILVSRATEMSLFLRAASPVRVYFQPIPRWRYEPIVLAAYNRRPASVAMLQPSRRLGVRSGNLDFDSTISLTNYAKIRLLVCRLGGWKHDLFWSGQGRLGNDIRPRLE